MTPGIMSISDVYFTILEATKAALSSLRAVARATKRTVMHVS